jgi:hypothetical protein
MIWSRAGRYGLSSSTYPAEAPWYRGNQFMRHICESGQPWSAVTDSGWVELYPAGVPMRTLACMSSSVVVIAEIHHHLRCGKLMQPVLIGQSHQIAQDPDVLCTCRLWWCQASDATCQCWSSKQGLSSHNEATAPPRILAQSSIFFPELSWQ